MTTLDNNSTAVYLISFASAYSSSLPNLLWQLKWSFILTTYPIGKVLFIIPYKESVITKTLNFELSFNRLGDILSKNQIIEFFFNYGNMHHATLHTPNSTYWAYSTQ